MAFTSYKRLTPSARGKLLRNWAQGVRESTQDLAAICTLELGKPLIESIKSLTYAANCLDWFANLAEQGCGGETIPNSGNGGQNRIWTIRQPVGVVCAITPWNSPYSGVLKKIAPALAVGCTVVHKPAPETPLCAIALSKLCQRAGFPPGVYNMLTSSSDSAAAVGSLFCSHSLVRHVTFTGSTIVGRYLGERCGANLKKITMELGGNAAFLVFKDADLNLAVKGLSHFTNLLKLHVTNVNGQSCWLASLTLLDRSVSLPIEYLLIKGSRSTSLKSSWQPSETKCGSGLRGKRVPHLDLYTQRREQARLEYC